MPRYELSEQQISDITRLVDAARLVTAAAPPKYLSTPLGMLAALADLVGMTLLHLEAAADGGREG